jgi:hypothetical protein
MSCRAAVGVLAGLTEAASLDARAVRLMPHRKGGDDLRPFCVVADRLGGRSGRDRKQLEIAATIAFRPFFARFAPPRENLCVVGRDPLSEPTTYHADLQGIYGSDGTRTRDLRRDRPARRDRLQPATTRNYRLQQAVP